MKTLLIIVAAGAAALAPFARTSSPPTAPPAPSALMQERPMLTEAGARLVLDAGAAYIRANGTTGAIAVTDEGGHLLALLRGDGTFPSASAVATAKARTAATFRRPTRIFEDSINSGRTAMTTVASVADFTPLQGGIPIVVRGHIVGAVGVSGAASAHQDEEIALAAAAALTETPAARPPSNTAVGR